LGSFHKENTLESALGRLGEDIEDVKQEKKEATEFQMLEAQERLIVPGVNKEYTITITRLLKPYCEGDFIIKLAECKWTNANKKSIKHIPSNSRATKVYGSNGKMQLNDFALSFIQDI